MDALFEVPEVAGPVVTLSCNVERCPRTYTGTVEQARAGGWTVYRGRTYGGREDTAEFCPACVNRGVRAPRARSRGTEQLTLAEC